MDLERQLEQYMPHEAAPIISRWISDSSCKFVINSPRRSKFGDYKAPFAGKGHRISVNSNLNRYAFLVTTVHEFAHLKTWKEYKTKVAPHGKEWKQNFRILMEPFLYLDIFPSDVKQAITSYLTNPSASSATNLALFRILKKYDIIIRDQVVLEDLPENSLFVFSSNRIFQKGTKLRKRYRCIEKSSGRVYLFNPLAEVRKSY